MRPPQKVYVRVREKEKSKTWSLPACSAVVNASAPPAKPSATMSVATPPST